MKRKLLTGIFILTLAFNSVCVFSQDVNYKALRSTFEQDGVVVLWNDGEITLLNNDVSIICNVGDNVVTANSKEYKLDNKIVIDEETAMITDGSIDTIKNIILYNNAVVDAIIADYDEILPLKTIKKNDKVLLCTWHRYPSSYIDGTETVAKYGEIFVFRADEVEEFAKNNEIGNNPILRMEQLIGLPLQKGYTHFTYFYANSNDVFRPTPDNNTELNLATLEFPFNVSLDHKNWLFNYSVGAYQLHKYPFTRLGYTYDWANNGTEYGLSEFVVKQNSTINVEKTFTNEEFFTYLREKANK